MKVKVSVIEESIKKEIPFKAGDFIVHEMLGKGIIVGFSDVSGEPLVFFYNSKVQEKYRYMVVSVFAESISFWK